MGAVLTWEQVWGILQETDRILQEITRKQEEAAEERRAQEADRRAQELDREIKHMSKEIRRLSKNVGGLNRSMGELMEVLIRARVWERFAAYPYNFTKVVPRIPIMDDQNRMRSDIDLLLLNDQWAMAVEVKRALVTKDVEHHSEPMDLILRYPPAAVLGKRLLGALAGGVADSPEVYDYAHSEGFFVLALSGESVVLVEPPSVFSPKAWEAG